MTLVNIIKKEDLESALKERCKFNGHSEYEQIIISPYDGKSLRVGMKCSGCEHKYSRLPSYAELREYREGLQLYKIPA